MKIQKSKNDRLTGARRLCSTPTRSRRWRQLAVMAALCGTLTGYAQTTTEDPSILLAGSPELCVDPPNGIAPVNPPPGGFGIDGDLRANTPVAGIGDWLQGAGGVGGFIVNDDGTVVDTAVTFHFPDAFTGAENNFQGGNKFNDSPNDWEWVTNPVLAKNNIHHAYMHLAKDADGDSWVFVSADRESNDGDSYIDFEYLQNTLSMTTGADGLAGGFVSAGPDGGRTVNDFVLSITFTKGGDKAGVCVWRWKLISPGVFDYVKESLGDLDGSLLAAVNAASINVPYGAFGGTSYAENTFAEVAVNLTDLVSEFDPCLSLGIKTVLVKTKTSQSPSATIVDFVAPKQIRFTLGLGADAGDDQVKCTSGTGETVVDLAGQVQAGAYGIASTTWSQVGGQAGDVTFGDASALNTTATLKAGVSSATIRLTVVDNKGCTKSDDMVVTAADSPNCILAEQPSTVEACSTENEFTAPDADGTYLWAIEGAGTIVPGTETSQTVKVNAGSVCDSSFTLKLTINLANDCVSRCEKTVLVKDTQKPTLVVPADVSVECDNIPAAGKATGADTCDAEVTVEYLGEEKKDGDCLNSYTLIRTWQATDNCKNTTVKSQTITVVDTTDPVLKDVPPDLTVECDKVPDPATPSATDNCDPKPVIGFKETVEEGQIKGTSIITRTWTATDACGNSSEASQVITVVDSTAPVISGVPFDKEITVECDQLPPSSNPTATDNCDKLISVEYKEETTPGKCPQERIITRTWTATDASGNTTVVTQIVNVVDTTPPVLTLPNDITVECTDSTAPDKTGVATALDNCDKDVVANYSDEVSPGKCPQERIITRTWTAADDCGNPASGVQTITVVDTKAPTVTQGSIAACYKSVADAEAAALAATSASDACGKATLSASTTGTCDATITVTATDECENSESVAYKTRIDNVKPVLSGVPNEATYQCTSEVPAAPAVTASDNCDKELSVSFDEKQSGDPCTGITIVRTWSATDNCGNTESKSQTIVVQDKVAPSLTAPKDLVLECGDPQVDAKIAAWLDSATASDACGTAKISNDYAQGTLNKGCGGTGEQLVTFFATDNCNSTSASARIIIKDTKAPILDGVPKDEEVKCVKDLPPAPKVTATDACDANVKLEFSEVTKPAVPFNMGFVTIRTWKATDACGNSVSATQKITNLYCDEWPDVTGLKFYDANVNGIMDDGEQGIKGWKIALHHYDDSVPSIYVFTDENGNFVIPHVPPGTYELEEIMPDGSWHASTPTKYIVIITDTIVIMTDKGPEKTAIFGNFCLGPGGGHTPGFWHNKNGLAKMRDGGLDAYLCDLSQFTGHDDRGLEFPELNMLGLLPLVDANGNAFDPANHKSMAQWILGNAVNMSYKLSSHVAAMSLNVESGFVGCDRLIYAPGAGNTGLGGNFITIRDLLADSITLLAANPLTLDGSAARSDLAVRKNALDNANNNRNFVQYKPCSFKY